MASSRKKNKSTPNGAAPQIYPEGVPVAEDGTAIEGAVVDPEILREIPLDKASARSMQQHRDIMKRKAAGERNTRWHADERYRFVQVKAFHPAATLSVEQVLPFEDKSIPTKPIDMFPSYDSMLDYARQYWRGDAATYKWIVGDNNNPIWAQGKFSFLARVSEAEDEEMAKGQADQQQQWQQTPQGGWWHPVFGMAPPGWHPVFGWGGQGQQQQMQPTMPHHVAQPAQPMQQPVQQPMQPIIVPTQQGASPDVTSQLVAALSQSQAEKALLEERIRQLAGAPMQQAPAAAPQLVALPNGQFWHPQYGVIGNSTPAPAPAVAAQEPARPRNVVEEASETLGQMRQLVKVGKDIASVFGGKPDDAPETDPEDIIPPMEMPLKVQEVGPVRYVTRKDDSPVDATTQLMFNADKISDFFKEGWKQLKETIDKRTELQRQQMEQQQGDPAELAQDRALQRAREITELNERQARALHTLRNLGDSPPPPPPQPTMQRQVQQPTVQQNVAPSMPVSQPPTQPAPPPPVPTPPPPAPTPPPEEDDEHEEEPEVREDPEELPPPDVLDGNV